MRHVKENGNWTVQNHIQSWMCEMSHSRNMSLLKLINPSYINWVLTRNCQPQTKETNYFREKIIFYVLIYILYYRWPAIWKFPCPYENVLQIFHSGCCYLLQIKRRRKHRTRSCIQSLTKRNICKFLITINTDYLAVSPVSIIWPPYLNNKLEFLSQQMVYEI